MDLFDLKRKIDGLREEKLKLQGGLMQLKTDLEEQGFKSIEDAERELQNLEKMMTELNSKYERDLKEVNDFLRNAGHDI